MEAFQLICTITCEDLLKVLCNFFYIYSYDFQLISEKALWVKFYLKLGRSASWFIYRHDFQVISEKTLSAEFYLQTERYFYLKLTAIANPRNLVTNLSSFLYSAFACSESHSTSEASKFKRFYEKTFFHIFTVGIIVGMPDIYEYTPFVATLLNFSCYVQQVISLKCCILFYFFFYWKNHEKLWWWIHFILLKNDIIMNGIINENN